MRPFIARQDTDKSTLFQAGEALATAVFNANGIPLPRVENKRLGSSYGLTCFGADGTSYVAIDVKHCKSPVKVPGYQWSFPASTKDCTPLGVTAHEFGHAALNWLERGRSSELRAKIMEVADSEPPVSGYGIGDPHEQFAEMFRLACLNPDLLRVGRPMRWELLQSLELMLPELTTWTDVLAHAHGRIIRATESWIGR